MRTADGDLFPARSRDVSTSPGWLLVFLLFAGLGLCGLAIVFAGLTTFSLEILRDYGRLVRRAEDVSPERFTRFQQVCWFMAASLGSIGLGLMWRRKRLGDFFDGVMRTAPMPQPLAYSPAEELTWWPGWLALILCVGALLRLSLLWNPMAYDESYSWINFASRPLLQALGDLNSTNNHLLNTLCMYISGRLFGPQEWALRLGAMTCGLLLLPVCFLWARRWFDTSTALLTTALLAVSPPLVTYSADARGYMSLMLAAVLLDDSLAQAAARRGGTERAWLQSGGAVILGAWSIITMGYAIVASSLWYLLGGGVTEQRPISDAHDVREVPPNRAADRFRHLVILGWLTAIVSSVLYIPGYICRGTLFLNDPVMRKSTAQSLEFLVETGRGLVGAFGLWTEGGVPAWGIGIGGLIGLWYWPRDRQSILRLIMPFLVVVVMNLVRHVAPPPRIFLWLIPWVCLVASHGVLSVARSLRVPHCATCGLVLAILGLGICHGATHWPVLSFPSDRTSYISVPDVIRRVQQEVAAAPGESHRLIAPLPCDLPSLFYMDRSGFRIPHNAQPQPGERIWLIARHHETPAAVLEDGLVQLHGWQDRFTPWQLVERYQTLDLYSSRALSMPEK